MNKVEVDLKIRLVACALALTACNQQGTTTMRAPLPEDHSAQAVQEILAADRAFNDEAKAKGTGPAFADFMDSKQGMLIQPNSEPIKGRDAIYNANYDGIVPAPLTWAPDAAFASKSGDFGASWGHWTYDGKKPDGAPTHATGKYVTVWRKDANGVWKGLMDTGVTDKPEPAAAPPAAPASQTPAPSAAMPSPTNQAPVIQSPGPNQPSAQP